MADIVSIINNLVATKGITVRGRTYKVCPMLCCDMKALVKILGLCDVFKPNTIYKCPWCEVRNIRFHVSGM